MSRASLAQDATFHPDEELKTCANCEDDIAILHCIECNASYCRPCSTILHKNSKMRTHTVRRISEMPEAPAAASLELDLDPLNDTSIQELMERDLSTIGLNPADIMEWQCAEVNCWVRHLGRPYSEYADRFEAEQIRGRLLPHVDEGALLRLGVSHRNVPAFMEAINRLQLAHQLAVIKLQQSSPPDVSIPTPQSGTCALPTQSQAC
eukprot:TRINITY_DN4690_c0_g1_i1.p1 TRINITY_DN4690_c0_g1~~TRINITY_DN4690_c0_g1_i1.p1  ORF type:complete len:207 (+),score=24.35 TRINITY_DN4690_c0_g1_i1:130-750(+)